MANLFSDGFESGDLTAWGGSQTDGGDLSVTAGAALHGSYGLSALIDDTVDIRVFDYTPTDETRYRARFYFDPNSVTMSADTNFAPCVGWTSGWGSVFIVYFTYTSSAYWIRLLTYTDTSSVLTSQYTITDAPHCIELDWKASSAPAANDGTFELLIDGVSKETLTGIDSDTLSVGHVALGTMALDAGTSGTCYFDDFASNNDGGEIGQITTGPAKLKTYNGLVTAKIKTINGLAIAKVKTINGLV